MIYGTNALGPKRKTADKLQNFEGGIEIQGNARKPIAVKYFLVAILFVLFDVEVIFFYPYAVNFRELGWSGFGAICMFIGFFLTGFIYIIKNCGLNWEDESYCTNVIVKIVKLKPIKKYFKNELVNQHIS
jgi:NADH-quinone oxidoreductase subunit A